MDLKNILTLFKKQGCAALTVKFLAKNDNSKQQVLWSSRASMLPAVSVESVKLASEKKTNKEKIIYRNSLDFYWVNEDGVFNAPNAKLIFYPQYPETRFSGFLQGCDLKIPDLQARVDRNYPPRVLILGRGRGADSYGMCLRLSAKLKKEIISIGSPLFGDKQDSSFFELTVGSTKKNNRSQLVAAMKKIVTKGWVKSCRMLADGIIIDYQAKNGGGMTLEAQLGIPQNSISAPDYLGWEVKQHQKGRNIISLFTPEPDGGLGGGKGGFAKFMKKYGYPATGKPGRLNFNGVHRVRVFNERTKMTLVLDGFKSGEITKANGSLILLDTKDNIAASWSFEKLLQSWTKKHSKAMFAVSERKEKRGIIGYNYLPEISLGVGTSFVKFLSGLEDGHIYLDPGHKITISEGGKTRGKSRTQFRVNKKNLFHLYDQFETVNVV